MINKLAVFLFAVLVATGCTPVTALTLDNVETETVTEPADTGTWELPNSTDEAPVFSQTGTPPF